MLIPFPLAFLIGGFVADLLANVVDGDDPSTVAYYLVAAGIVTALLAAVPGLIDYRGTVPPNSSGKKRARKHMAANLSAVGLFALAWFLRGGPGVPAEPLLLLMEGTGAILLTLGGWMGGTLSFRNQIGVDHRYANAGKWSEERVGGHDNRWVRAAGVDDLGPDQMKLLHVGNRRIVLARTGEEWAAFSDRCTHRGGSLAGGVVVCGTVSCPWHGSQFSVVSGAVSAGPATDPIATFPVEIRERDVWIDTSG